MLFYSYSYVVGLSRNSAMPIKQKMHYTGNDSQKRVTGFDVLFLESITKNIKNKHRSCVRTQLYEGILPTIVCILLHSFPSVKGLIKFSVHLSDKTVVIITL